MKTFDHDVRYIAKWELSEKKTESGNSLTLDDLVEKAYTIKKFIRKNLSYSLGLCLLAVFIATGIIAYNDIRYTGRHKK